jgi:hypothetical protein
MDVESLAKQLILQNMTPEQQSAVLESVRATLQEARGNQKRRVGENVGLVVDALKKIEADIRAKYDDLGQKITTRVNSIRDGRDGINGSDGRDGLDGRPGRDGAQGPAGPAGRDGVNGVDGVDGVSVIDAKIDFDGSLIIYLSNGRELNVGEVMSPDAVERIRILTYAGDNSGGGGGDTGLTYKGTWNATANIPLLISSVGDNGDYYIVSVAGTTDLNGITDWQPGDWVIFNGTAWQKIDQSWATAGVNNNITSMTGITGGISSPDFIQFDTTATVTDATGRLYYNDEDMYQTLAFQMNGNVIQHVGEEMFYRVRLSAAATKGQVLMFTGTLGASGGLTAAPATGLTFDQSNYLLGIAGESGSTNDWITVYEFGEVKGVNTSAFTQGQILYYDPTVAGGLTATKPNTPNAIAVIAAVVHVGTSNGVLFVRPTFGSALGGTDGNVRFGTLASGNTIIYDAVDGVWKNANLTDGTGISITEGAGSITITNSAPDQTVALTGAGTTSISGTYPNFTVTSDDQYVGTVTSVGGTGTVNGLSLSGTVTSSGSLTLGGALTGTASININGTVGATTPTTGAFTTLSSTGNTTLGDASTDTVTVNGYMGVGGAGSTTAGLYVRNTALTGTGQYGFLSDITATSAATSTAAGLWSRIQTQAAAFTLGNGYGIFVQNAVKGAGSTITNHSGVVVADQTQGTNNYGILSLVSSGTNKWNIYASGTAANYFAGNMGVGTTSPAKQLDLAANNTGITTGDPLNTLRFTDTDTTSATGQPMGRIEWYSADADTAGVKAYIQTQSTDGSPDADMVFATNHVSGGGTAERMRIQYDGNVGIGTSSPSVKLEVKTSGSVNIKASTDSNAYSYLTLNAWALDRAQLRAEAGGGSGSGSGAGVLSFWTSNSSSSLTERARIDSGGDFQFNSGYGSVATAYGCRAWVNFNGTGTVAIRASANVSSITDNGTGQFTVNFQTSMPDVNYSVTGAGMRNSASGGPIQSVNLRRSTTYSDGFQLGSVSLSVGNGADAFADPLACCIAVFR